MTAFVPIVFLSVLLGALYRLALITYNQTHLDLRNDRVKITRKPLPIPFDASRSVSMMNVESIRCEETKKGKKCPCYGSKSLSQQVGDLPLKVVEEIGLIFEIA